MMTREISSQNWVKEVDDYIKSGTHGILWSIQDRPVVLIYRKGQVDESVCDEMGYNIYELFYNGGTIISNGGDVGMAHFGEVNNDWCKRFAEHFTKWLKNKGLNAEITKNDILVDGYKVVAMCVTRYGRIDYTCIHIGINTDIEAIKRICKKPMVKVPKGLSEYGITTEEVKEMFLDFCGQFED